MPKHTRIISGFPGVGKTTVSRLADLTVLDSDSSEFSWIEPDVRHPDFPNNYIEHIKQHIGQADIILVSSHDIVRKALEQNDLAYTLVYLDQKLEQEYLERYARRGSPREFIDLIDEHWTPFLEDIQQETYPTHLVLKENEFLADVLDQIKTDSSN